MVKISSCDLINSHEHVQWAVDRGMADVVKAPILLVEIVAAGG